jgi:hypothetical protein
MTADVIVVPAAKNLVAELEAIAPNTLREELDAWPRIPAGRAARLAQYLREEMAAYGMLSVEKAREAGHSLGVERAEARRVLAKLAAHGI